MAITTLDLLVAGLLPPEDIYKASASNEAAGVLHSLLYATGRPGAGTAPSPGLAGAALTSYAGQIPFPGAVGGKNIHLAQLDIAAASGVGGVRILDRLWHNSGFTVTTTTAQTVTSATWPARDNNGATSGEGVMVAIEVSTATTNAGAITNMTMSYTNQAGTSGRTASIASFPATAVAGTFVPFTLQAGDTGVQSIQSLTLGTSLVTGTVHLVAYRKVASIGTLLANASYCLGPVDLGLPRFYDTSVPFLVVIPTGTTVGNITGQVTWAQG